MLTYKVMEETRDTAEIMSKVWLTVSTRSKHDGAQQNVTYFSPISCTDIWFNMQTKFWYLTFVVFENDVLILIIYLCQDMY
jgi:hypothetical protein